MNPTKKRNGSPTLHNDGTVSYMDRDGVWRRERAIDVDMRNVSTLAETYDIRYHARGHYGIDKRREDIWALQEQIKITTNYIRRELKKVAEMEAELAEKMNEQP